MKTGLVVLSAVLALSGCKGDPQKDTGAGTAQGQVLPGSASDAMLPLDTVKSQAPLAPSSEGGEGSNKSVKPGKRGRMPTDTAKSSAVAPSGVATSAAATGAASTRADELKPVSSPIPLKTPGAN